MKINHDFTEGQIKILQEVVKLELESLAQVLNHNNPARMAVFTELELKEVFQVDDLDFDVKIGEMYEVFETLHTNPNSLFQMDEDSLTIVKYILYNHFPDELDKVNLDYIFLWELLFELEDDNNLQILN